jgi:hypothetical protein
MSTFRFTWGDTVRVSLTAPPQYRPGSLGAICGLRTVTEGGSSSTEQLAVSGDLYLVEFGDGFTIEIPDRLLEEIPQ